MPTSPAQLCFDIRALAIMRSFRILPSVPQAKSKLLMFNRIVHRHVSSFRSAAGARAFSRMPFRVQRGAITSPSNPIHDNQRVECTWTIRRDDSAFARHRSGPPGVEKLKVLTPGLTIVRVRPELHELIGQDAVARVRVSSNNADVLRSVRVASAWPNRTRVDFCPPSHDSDLVAHLVTEIDLPHAHGLRSLAAIGLGDVVVASDVLFAGRDDAEAWKADEYRSRRRRARDCAGRGRGGRQAQSLKLVAANKSRLFVDASTIAMRLNTLQVGVWGTHSQVTMDVAALDLQHSLGVGVVGGRDSSVVINADSLIASRLKLMAMGNSKLDLAVRRHLEVDDIKTVAIGDGVVHVQAPKVGDTKRQPTTRHQATTAVGSAWVDTASVPTEYTKLIAIGSNDVCLQARNGLRVRSVGASVVECVGRLPPQLNVRGFPSPVLIETPTEEPSEVSDGNRNRTSPYPTAEEAFQHESLLSTARSNFISRWFGHRGRGEFFGGSQQNPQDETQTSLSGNYSRAARARHHTRWADEQST